MRIESGQWVKNNLMGLLTSSFIFSLVISDRTMSQTMPNAPQKLRVMSYNIKGTPKIVGGNTNKKMRRITEAIIRMVQDGTAPDVIQFQEVFTKEARDHFVELHDKGYYPYMVEGPSDEGRATFGSGLMTLSRIPIRGSGSVSFGKSCTDWDCMANKGAHLANIQADNWPEPIMIINTHLQATNDYDKVRIEQMNILKEALKDVEAAGYNMIIGGDFNSKPIRPSYNYFKSLFPSFINVGEFCSNSRSGCLINSLTPVNHILNDTKDHQFFSCSRRAAIIPVGFVRNFSDEVDGLELSDHKAYQVDYIIDWSSNKRCHLE